MVSVLWGVVTLQVEVKHECLFAKIIGFKLESSAMEKNAFALYWNLSPWHFKHGSSIQRHSSDPDGHAQWKGLTLTFKVISVLTQLQLVLIVTMLGQGIMLVYDITNEKSFDNIKNWIRNIEEHASSDVERMILGNKCDMNDKRQVSKERGEKLAIDYGIKFLETSAKSSTNVEEHRSPSLRINLLAAAESTTELRPLDTECQVDSGLKA
ncbi:hypothetical protein P7K49_017015 [Saguinus oedipus]|uniref:small monomeric GTPase n=1 Tax=Saguinus oedipus TaxID=9490 RepID=A0ABQ9V1A4_SAGOE|nr:hypothetical protein P7K49_017015 [Saguinus oedipus]